MMSPAWPKAELSWEELSLQKGTKLVHLQSRGSKTTKRSNFMGQCIVLQEGYSGKKTILLPLRNV